MNALCIVYYAMLSSLFFIQKHKTSFCLLTKYYLVSTNTPPHKKLHSSWKYALFWWIESHLDVYQKLNNKYFTFLRRTIVLFDGKSSLRRRLTFGKKIINCFINLKLAILNVKVVEFAPGVVWWICVQCNSLIKFRNFFFYLFFALLKTN